jgi:hypothetical protein
MGQADIADVKKEAAEVTSPIDTQNVTKNASQAESSIINQTVVES